MMDWLRNDGLTKYDWLAKKWLTGLEMIDLLRNDWLAK